jgi:membrane protease YdiL (CAAX protease family)
MGSKTTEMRRRRLFTWHPTKETFVPFAAGLVVIALSVSMILTERKPWLSMAIRDIGQMVLAGVFFPLAYMTHCGETLRSFGVSLRNWRLFLSINIMLGGILLVVFLFKEPPSVGFRPDWWKLAFIMCAGIFETLFFYAFLRTLFERAFGIVPAIILSALFYAFHHAGFQPEYGKLFFVGLMYATAFRIGKSALIIYPFFWGVGAGYDVLVQSQAVSPIVHPEARTLYVAVLMVGALIFFAVLGQSRKPKEDTPCLRRSS